MPFVTASVLAMLSWAAPQAGGTPIVFGPTLSPPRTERVDRLLEKAREDIRQARRDGRLMRRQAEALRRDSHRIEDAGERFGSDGLSQSEAAELRNRADALRSLATAAAPPAGRR